MKKSSYSKTSVTESVKNVPTRLLNNEEDVKAIKDFNSFVKKVQTDYQLKSQRSNLAAAKLILTC